MPEEDRESFLRFDHCSNWAKAPRLGSWDGSLTIFVEGSVLQRNKLGAFFFLKPGVLYDPLVGALDGAITKAKIFPLKLCREKLSLNESFPHAIYSDWDIICCNFTRTQRAMFRSYPLSSQSDVKMMWLSIEAYGACVYVVFKSTGSESYLHCSKSRIAPLKMVMVPKLDLSGAELLARKNYSIPILAICCWNPIWTISYLGGGIWTKSDDLLNNNINRRQRGAKKRSRQ